MNLGGGRPGELIGGWSHKGGREGKGVSPPRRSNFVIPEVEGQFISDPAP